MSNSIYNINKGINTSIEFKGLKAQYIWYFGGLVVALMIGFAILYIAGVNVYFCMALIGGTGTLLTLKIFKMSHEYGEYGMMKLAAKRRVPKVIKSYTRKIFQADKEDKR